MQTFRLLLTLNLNALSVLTRSRLFWLFSLYVLLGEMLIPYTIMHPFHELPARVWVSGGSLFAFNLLAGNLLLNPDIVKFFSNGTVLCAKPVSNGVRLSAELSVRLCVTAMIGLFSVCGLLLADRIGRLMDFPDSALTGLTLGVIGIAVFRGIRLKPFHFEPQRSLAGLLILVPLLTGILCWFFPVTGWSAKTSILGGLLLLGIPMTFLGMLFRKSMLGGWVIGGLGFAGKELFGNGSHLYPNWNVFLISDLVSANSADFKPLIFYAVLLSLGFGLLILGISSREPERIQL